jgi:hypothetical protein
MEELGKVKKICLRNKKITPRIIIEMRNKKLKKNCLKKCWCKPPVKSQ